MPICDRRKHRLSSSNSDVEEKSSEERRRRERNVEERVKVLHPVNDHFRKALDFKTYGLTANTSWNYNHEAARNIA